MEIRLAIIIWWTTNFMENIDHILKGITIESAKFILEQSEKRLHWTIDTSKAISDRAVKVMQLSIPLSLCLIGLIVNGHGGELLVLYWLAFVVLTIISYYCLDIYDVYDMELPSYRFDDLLNDLSTSPDARQQHLELLLIVHHELEKATEQNDLSNRRRDLTLFWVLVSLKFLLPLAGAYIAMDLMIRLIEAYVFLP